MHKVEKQIEINAPVEEVFALFSRFDHFARWMKGIKNVEWIAAKRTRWTAEAPDGALLEWEAEVTELEPGRHIAWHSISGNVEAEGAARFAATPQGTTMMQLTLGYDQPQAPTDEASIAAFNQRSEQLLGEDLIWFRLYAEREAQAASAAENIEAAPALPAVATPPSSPAAEESPVHFDSFSGMLRAGQVIRPARPITAQFEEPAEPMAIRPPADYSRSAAAAQPSRRSALPYAIIGLLLVVAIGLFAATRRREKVAEQPIAEPVASPSSGKSSNKPTATITADSRPPSIAPTLVPEATALPAATLEPRAAGTDDDAPTEGSDADADTRGAISATINGWLAATNEKNVDAQMSFYAPVLQRYYRRNNYARAAVRADKARRFAQADSVQMSASAPEISLEQGGRVARVRFRKEYEVVGSAGTQSGEVLQELILIKSGDGWRIASERDLRVLR